MATVKCPCGNDVIINTECILMTKCDDCGRIAAHGNDRTGEIYSWMTPRDVDSANANYQEQLFSADNNEFYGRGNW